LQNVVQEVCVSAAVEEGLCISGCRGRFVYQRL